MGDVRSNESKGAPKNIKIYRYGLMDNIVDKWVNNPQISLIYS